MSGKVENLFIKRNHGQPMHQVADLQTIAYAGIIGDASYGRKKRQILIVEQSILKRFKVNPGDLRENLVVSGMQLSAIQSGSLLRIGDTLLEVTTDCKPCDMLNELHPGMRDDIDGERGLLVRVLEEGTIRVGDPVVQLPQNNASIIP